MARKRKNTNAYYYFAVCSVTGLLLALAIIKALSNSDPKCPPFPYEAYLNGDPMWTKQDYFITGKFQYILLKTSSGDDTLCSITVCDKNLSLPVIFKPSALTVAPQRDQKIKLKVQVEDNGRIVAHNCIAD